MNNVFEVVGIVSGISKKSNKPYIMLHCLRNFLESNTQHREGMECVTQYLEGACPIGVSVGSTVEFEYMIGGNGYPTVCGVHAVEVA